MSKNLKTLSEKTAAIRDISEFCEKWPDLKKLHDVKEVENLSIEPEIKELIVWLYKLADRVCPGSRI